MEMQTRCEEHIILEKIMELSSLMTEAVEHLGKQREVSQTLDGALPKEFSSAEHDLNGDLPKEGEGTFDPNAVREVFQDEQIGWKDVKTVNDSGSEIYRIAYDGERSILNNTPPENATIFVGRENGSDIRYETDEKGRVAECNIPSVERQDGVRNDYQQARCVDTKDGIHGRDDGGHLLAREYGGPAEQINLLPMESGINRNGEWRRMEKEIGKYLDAGNSVTDLSIKPQYEGDSRRPTGFEVEYSVSERRNGYIDNPIIGDAA